MSDEERLVRRLADGPFEEAMARSAAMDAVGDRGALDVLMDGVDEAIGATDWLGRALGHPVPERVQDGFDRVDRWLGRIDVQARSVRWILAALTMTAHLWARLPSRQPFFERVRAHFLATDPARVQDLLVGLEGGGPTMDEWLRALGGAGPRT